MEISFTKWEIYILFLGSLGNVFPVSADTQLPLAQNNSDAKVACFGVTYSGTLIWMTANFRVQST